MDDGAYDNAEEDAVYVKTSDPQPDVGGSGDDGSAWDERALCPPPCVVVSERYGLVASPRGTIYSMRVAQTPEEEEQQARDYEAWMAEVVPQGDYTGDDAYIGARVNYKEGADEDPHADSQDDDDDDEEERVEDRDVGRKRRQPVLRCHYKGCPKAIAGMPLTCPSPVDGDKDLPHLFCSYESMLAWAFYDVGAPLCYRFEILINQRAGYPVKADPSPCDSLFGANQPVNLDPAAQLSQVVYDLVGEEGTHTHFGGGGGDAMETDEPLSTDKLVPCRLCKEERLAGEAVCRINLNTAATWAFCSEECAMLHPGAKAGDFMELIEFADCMKRGQRHLLVREGWGTESNDV